MTPPTVLNASQALEEHIAQDPDLDELCERWVHWSRTRRLYGPGPITGTILGKLQTSPTRPMRHFDAPCSAALSALHIAITCQPNDALDKKVFEMYYVHRIKPVKLAADALGISRKHFYTLLAAFRRRIVEAAKAIEGNSACRTAVVKAWAGVPVQGIKCPADGSLSTVILDGSGQSLPPIEMTKAELDATKAIEADTA